MKMFDYMILQLNGKGNDVKITIIFEVVLWSIRLDTIESTIPSHSLLIKLSTGQAYGKNLEMMWFVVIRPWVVIGRVDSSPS